MAPSDGYCIRWGLLNMLLSRTMPYPAAIGFVLMPVGLTDSPNSLKELDSRAAIWAPTWCCSNAASPPLLCVIDSLFKLSNIFCLVTLLLFFVVFMGYWRGPIICRIGDSLVPCELFELFSTIESVFMPIMFKWCYRWLRVGRAAALRLLDDNAYGMPIAANRADCAS